jgi:hypothetical protein
MTIAYREKRNVKVLKMLQLSLTFGKTGYSSTGNITSVKKWSVSSNRLTPIGYMIIPFSRHNYLEELHPKVQDWMSIRMNQNLHIISPKNIKNILNHKYASIPQGWHSTCGYAHPSARATCVSAWSQ